MSRRSHSLGLFVLVCLCALPVSGQQVLTYHNDNTRQGVNTNETILTPADVNTNEFGKLFSVAVDGFVYAQPLVMTHVNIPGKGLHNVVYVATEHNSIYAFDADNNSGANAAPLWHTSFLGPGVTTVPAGETGTPDVVPEVGISSTPVIDPATATIYLEVKTKEGEAYVHRLHALDVATGRERGDFHSPVVIAWTNYPGMGDGDGDNDGLRPPHVKWNPLRAHSRMALTLVHGTVFVGFASHGDNGPYHGWLFGYNGTNLAQAPGVFNSTPNGGDGGFWEAGGGASVDDQGNLFLQTGNGTFDGGKDLSLSKNYSMSMLKLATSNGLTLVDYFAPSNAVELSGADQDLGSSSALILPDSAGSAAHPHLVLGGGKTSPVYVVDRDQMGRFNGTAGRNLIVQQFNGGPGGDRNVSPAFFRNTLYMIDFNSRIGAFKIAGGRFNPTPVESPDSYDNKGGATVSISAHGESNGVAWAIYESGADPMASPCILRAYNATNLAVELYRSDQLPARDAAGNGVKFTLPTISGGKVYVGAQYSLTVYGLAPLFVRPPTITPAGGVYASAVTVTLADATPGAMIYYTLDGTAPTTNGTRYTAPLVLTNSVTVTAAAFAPGAVAGEPVRAGFVNTSMPGQSRGLWGQYWTKTTSREFAAPGFAASPTLERLDPTVNFNWGSGSPDASVSDDNFIARWTGTVTPEFSEVYTFSTTTDDGARLWVNGQLLVDKWVDQAGLTWSGTMRMSAQQRYNIRMDYFENGGGASAVLAWSSPSTRAGVIPESQLNPVANPPPSVRLTAPAEGSVFTASASVALAAEAAAQFNTLSRVDFYTNAHWAASISNAPYRLTFTGIPAGQYRITAVATDGSGLTNISAPVNFTVREGRGQPYGLTKRDAVPAYFHMPTNFSIGAMPARLSLTGVFSATASLTPARGLIAYAPIVPLWSDGARKTRWLAVPNQAAPYAVNEQIGFLPTNEWTFPAGTVFVKHFDLVTNEVTGATRRLETRLLVCDAHGAAYGVTYKWREDNSEADLLATNLSEVIPIVTAAGPATQTWYYPSPAECMSCHTADAGYVLGLKTRQLNTTYTYPGTGVKDNQLRTLNRLGLFNPPLEEAAIAGLEKLSALTDRTRSLEERARSYLDANCAQCHRPPHFIGPTFDAGYDTPLSQQHLIKAVLAKGNLGDPNTRVVVPKDIWRSALQARMNTTNHLLAMPNLARNIIDTNAVQVIADWINSLDGTPALAPPAITPGGGTFPSMTRVSLESDHPGAKLFYTLDGTVPGTNSLLYSGTFVVSTNLTVTASAFAEGFNPSFAATAQFEIQATGH